MSSRQLEILSPVDAARRERQLSLAGFGAVLGIRVAVFPFAQNFYGDPAMRLKAVTAWLAHPSFLRSFAGARQFGPLHLYLLGLGQWIHRDLFEGPRLVALIFGSLSAFPLFRLTARRFGASAGLLATLSLAIYPLHIQSSTTATSEAVFLFFLLWAFICLDRACDTRRPRDLALAALAMAAACAVRYDGWLYAPLSWCWLLRPWRERKLGAVAVLGYAAATLAVPAFLLWGNWVDLGDPLYVVRYIDADHFANAARAAAAMGRGTYALYCLTFWPANLAWELSPPVALGAALGLAASLREGRACDLWLTALIPAALFSIEGALWLRFHPLARFTLPTAVLLLPYAGDGLMRLWPALPRARGLPMAALGTALGLALPTFIAASTLGRSGKWADTLRPISPVSNLPPDLSNAAAWLVEHAGRAKVEVATNWLYEELPIEFYGSRGGARLFTPRDGDPPAGFEPPDFVVLPHDADVVRSGAAHLDGAGLLLRDTRFEAVAQLGRVTIWSRATGPREALHGAELP